MKLLIVRHGDPDYTIDSLTEKGWKEVEFLSEKLSKLDIKDFYVCFDVFDESGQKYLAANTLT